MDEYLLQRRIYFLIFIDLLDKIFSQCRETCEVLLDYPIIGGDDVIGDYAKMPSETFCMQILMYTAED